MSNNDIELDYNYLTQKALRNVMRDVLNITAELGDVPGEHHFYIEFVTNAPGVEISDELKSTYPERMTIVLQHKFENLIVGDEHFEVTLHFQGDPDRLVIPFAAVANFVDPSCDFGIQFDVEEIEAAADAMEDDTTEEEAQPEDDTPSDDSGDESAGTADVVSLDAFRKK